MPHGQTGAGVELDDAVDAAAATAFVQHRALQHGVGIVAVRADGQAFKAPVGALAGGVAGVACKVGRAVPALRGIRLAGVM